MSMRVTQNETGSQRAAYSIAEVAQRFGVSQGLIRLQILRGKLKAGRIGRRVVISAGEVDRLIEAGTIPALAERSAR